MPSSKDFDGYIFLGFKDGEATFYSRYGSYDIPTFLLNVSRFLVEAALEIDIDAKKKSKGSRLPTLRYEGDA